ncbi:MAG: hypothetical protein VB055_00810 [Oscillospiraceae bacterium]|nr:hypothetical protein [Oscillospiraceae bacterium]
MNFEINAPSAATSLESRILTLPLTGMTVALNRRAPLESAP